LILEEAWAYMGHAVLREKMVDYFKTLRKANVAVLFISQDLADIVESSAASLLQNACMTRIFLANAAAVEPSNAKHYQSLGLNPCQINMIKSAVPKQDYYYHSQRGSRIFRLALGELAKSFLCVEGKQAQEKFNRLYQKNNPKWILDWLDYQGLSDWRKFARQHYLGGANEKC